MVQRPSFALIRMPETTPDISIANEIARIRQTYGLSSELLTLDELARVMGRTPKAMANLKSRGQLPAIPSLLLGGRECYWIRDVVLWLSRSAIDSTISTDPARRKAGEAELASLALARQTPSATNDTQPKRSPGRPREMSFAKEALIKKGEEILELRRKQGRAGR